MGKNYVPITYDYMRKFLEDELGFEPIKLDGCWEFVWELPVVTRSGRSFPYNIRVYSSIDMNTKITRECGADAIRVVLFDNKRKRAMKKAERRVYRTKSAITNLKSRIRSLFREVIDPENHCPRCGSHMLIRIGRNGKFKGCTDYPICKGTKEIQLT